MVTPEQFDHYFFKVQELACCALDQNSRNALLQYIQNEKEKNLDPPYEDFFKGEYEFYSGQYKNALKYYIQAQTIPYFKLFCYRASAYVSKGSDEIEKALAFAEKAQRIFPDDYATLVILEELLTLDQNHDAAHAVRNKIHDLEVRYGAPFTSPKKRMEFIESFNLLIENTNVEDATEDSFALLKPQAFIPNGPLEGTQQPLVHGSHPSATASQIATLVIGTVEEPMSFVEPENHKTEIPPQPPKKDNSLFQTSLEDPLATRIHYFRQKQKDRLDAYLSRWQTRSHLSDNALFVLFGWNPSEYQKEHSFLIPKPSGGYFIRWNGKGIVINPGRNFLTFFHQQGMHIKDINYVIVTNDNPDSYSDVYEIYRLLHRLNQQQNDHQVIHYYFVPKVFQAVNSALKPNFKQERNNVHALELFLDSPNIEQTELAEDIKLSYFALSDAAKENLLSHLGIRLELKMTPEGSEEPISLGYLSETTWSTDWCHHLSNCDILISGFGETNAEDSAKKRYHDKALGYFGTLTLAESTQPKLLICSEFSGNDGDIRLEVVKLLRKEMQNQNFPTVILPADTCLEIDLHTLRAPCTVSKMSVNVAEMAITQSSQPFGNLQFLSPYCCIK